MIADDLLRCRNNQIYYTVFFMRIVDPVLAGNGSSQEDSRQQLIGFEKRIG